MHLARAMEKVRCPRPDEFPRLLDWLDDGLRGGRRGRLAAEYPVALSPADLGAHLLIEESGGFLSHAFVRRVDAVAREISVSLGMIGLVYSAPEARNRGLASACVEAAIAELARSGAQLIALWTDRTRFYTRLGFGLSGREWIWRLDAARVERARRISRDRDDDGSRPRTSEVSGPRERDAEILERAASERPAFVRRAPGQLARAWTAADCEVKVARRDGVPVAYSALGRGDDFPGIVHEWAGEPAALLDCLSAHLETRTAIGLLSSSAGEPLTDRLRDAGAVASPGGFAWLRIVDASALWSSIVAKAPGLSGTALSGAGDSFTLEAGAVKLSLRHRELCALIAGPRLPAGILADLPEPWLGALRERLPLPLFVWGFDSI